MEFDILKKYVMQGIEIVKLQGNVAAKIAKDEKATNYAFAIIALVGLAQAIGTLNLPGIIVLPIGMLIGSFIWVGITQLLAKLFGGKASFMELYRAMGVGYSPMLISVIPFLGPFVAGILGLWYLVVEVVVLKAVHKLSTGKAVLVVAIPVIIAMVIGIIVAAMFAAMFASMLGAGLTQI